ncbi:MAG: endonuclease/exonuclease/phosphatase family protein [Chloroflexota bacterium]
MKILFWNIRAGGGKRVDEIAQQITAWNPDIIALAEFRGTPPSTNLRGQLAELGWPHQAATTHQTEKPAVNALLTASRYPITVIDHTKAPQEPGRWLMTEIASPMPTTLINIHVPNRVTGRKYPFHDAVLDVLRVWDSEKRGPALVVGDTNTGLPELDGSTGTFTKPEIAWMHALENLQWRDALRYLHGEKRVYTWYSPNAGNGFRLDEAFINPALLPYLHTIEHPWGVSPTNPTRRDALSDHAAMLVTFQGSTMNLKSE